MLVGVRARLLDQLVDAEVSERLRLGDDALVRAVVGQVVERLARDELDLDAEALRLALDVAHQAVALAQVVGHEDVLQRHVGAQRLDNRTLAFNEISHGIAFVVVVQW